MTAKMRIRGGRVVNADEMFDSISHLSAEDQLGVLVQLRETHKPLLLKISKTQAFIKWAVNNADLLWKDIS